MQVGTLTTRARKGRAPKKCPSLHPTKAPQAERNAAQSTTKVNNVQGAPSE